MDEIDRLKEIADELDEIADLLEDEVTKWPYDHRLLIESRLIRYEANLVRGNAELMQERRKNG